jgi:hypothetical protein
MEYPPLWLNVVAILDTGEEKIGYWTGDIWMQGVENDPVDIEMTGNVVSWRTWP